MSKKIYFASDFHLGLDLDETSKVREERIVRWLKSICHDAETVYLIGDIFDYWFEYKRVIPKGYIKLISQLSQMRDADIEIIMFTGNHDMWMFDYFEEELGIVTHHHPIIIDKHGKKLMIGHGDGLGPGDINYKIIKKIFSNPVCQWLFERIHPNTGLALMRYISGSSDREYGVENNFLGADKEWLVQYCEKHPKRDEIDFFIFGHRHLALDYTLSNGKSRYINTGDWLEFNSYAVFDAGQLTLQYYDR